MKTVHSKSNPAGAPKARAAELRRSAAENVPESKMLISERHQTIINSMTGEERARYAAIQARVREVAEAVRAYRTAGGDRSQPLYYFLRDHGFSNDEIWIHSPHIGGEVGADEPEWV